MSIEDSTKRLREALAVSPDTGAEPLFAVERSALSHLLAALDEREALREDAERYRWLRDPANASRDEWNLFGPYSSGQEIDDAIDAARKEPT